MSEEVFKICLVGCGGMTNGGHGPSCRKYVQEHTKSVLAACCDINIEAAERACQKFGFARAYTDYVKMVQEEQPDVVMAITPVNLTKEISVRLLDMGVPVILEKPPGMDAEETLAIHEAAVRNKVPARAAFNRRYMPLVRALKEEMKKQKSQVLDISCMFVRVGRTDADFSTTTIHGIDTVKYIAESEYKEVYFRYNDIMYQEKAVTNIQMSAQMTNGATASVTFLPCGGCVAERISVTMTDYTFFLFLPVWGGVDAPGKLVCMKNGEIYKTIAGTELVKEYTLYETNGFYDESAEFFDMLRNGQRPESDVISGLTSVELAHCIRQRKEKYIK